jgi:hypothetical protein
MLQSAGKSYAARIVCAALFLGTLAWSGTAWAIVNTDTDIPVTANGHDVPSGTVTITDTATGKTISTSKITQGKTHLTIHNEKLTEKTKVTVTVVNGDTHETTKQHDDLGLILSGGIVAVTQGAATQASSLRTAIQTANSGGGIWIEAGFGASITGLNNTTNFFGPGVGSGGLTTDRSWQGSVTGSVGVFTAIAPSWFGGVVAEVSSPPFSTTRSAVTSTGVFESSLTTQSGPAVDVMGRVGWAPGAGFILNNVLGTPGNQFGGPTIFVEGGVDIARYKSTTLTAADNFSGTATVTSPIVGVGVGLPVCSLLGITTCTPAEAATKFQVVVDEIFANSNWNSGITALSSGQGQVKDQTRVTAEIVIPFGYNVPDIVSARVDQAPLSVAHTPALSDIRLKRDITQLAFLDNGIKLYSFRYFWSDQVYVGVMAQQVAAIVPEAVVMEPNGYLAVYYDRLGLKMQTLAEWQASDRVAAPVEFASP